MKKTLLYILPAVVFALAIIGCGEATVVEPEVITDANGLVIHVEKKDAGTAYVYLRKNSSDFSYAYFYSSDTERKLYINNSDFDGTYTVVLEGRTSNLPFEVTASGLSASTTETVSKSTTVTSTYTDYTIMTITKSGTTFEIE